MTNQEKVTAAQLNEWANWLDALALRWPPLRHTFAAYLRSEAKRLTTAPVADNELREAVTRLRGYVAKACTDDDYARDLNLVLDAAEKSLEGAFLPANVKSRVIDGEAADEQDFKQRQALARAEERAEKLIEAGNMMVATIATLDNAIHHEKKGELNYVAVAEWRKARDTEATPDTEEKDHA